MQYKEIIQVVNQQVLLQSNLNHRNSMANHMNHNSFLVRMVRLKPEKDCNYCKDLGHLKYNCPKLKEKEARMAGHRNYNKSKKEN